MRQPGIEVRRLWEMTGGATFNEVFLTDARVSDANRIGNLTKDGVLPSSPSPTNATQSGPAA
jgi:alkylation response protein AidB-like acyl-CoA dehydrogenase